VSSPVLDAGEAMIGLFRDNVVVRVGSRSSGIGTGCLSRRLRISAGPGGRLPRDYVTVAGVARFVERRGR
jgi:hypothetical protein